MDRKNLPRKQPAQYQDYQEEKRRNSSAEAWAVEAEMMNIVGRNLAWEKDQIGFERGPTQVQEGLGNKLISMKECLFFPKPKIM